MSHIEVRQTSITSIPALRDAATRCGLTLTEATSFKGYGNSQHPCQFKISGDMKYEIGVNPGTKPGEYSLAADWFLGSVAAKVGDDFVKLINFYEMETSRHMAMQMGHGFRELHSRPDGSIEIEIDIPDQLPLARAGLAV